MKNFISLVLMFYAAAGLSAPYEVDRAQSIFAVVTHKAGLASALAHNHLVYPSSYQIALEADDFPTKISLEFQTANLVIDDVEMQQRFYPALKDAKILAEPFSEAQAKDREEMRKAMLAGDQLAAGQFPTIKAETIKIGQDPTDKARLLLTTALTIRGKTVKRDLVGRLSSANNQLAIEIAGSYKFTDFGIEPFSAFMGAVRNQDTFHVFARIVARKDREKGTP
jgi:hypothetical protein